MFGAIPTVATAAAPHVGRVVIAGTKAVAGLYVANKAQRYTRDRAEDLVNHVSDAKQAAKEAREDVTGQDTTDNVTQVRSA